MISLIFVDCTTLMHSMTFMTSINIMDFINYSNNGFCELMTLRNSVSCVTFMDLMFFWWILVVEARSNWQKTAMNWIYSGSSPWIRRGEQVRIYIQDACCLGTHCRRIPLTKHCNELDISRVQSADRGTSRYVYIYRMHVARDTHCRRPQPEKNHNDFFLWFSDY